MKTRNFLITSLIIHLIILVVIAFIILPPVGNYKEFFDSLSVDFVKIKPFIREEKYVKNKVKPVAQIEPKAETENTPKIPKSEGFFVATGGAFSIESRDFYNEKTITQSFIPSDKGVKSNQKPILKDIKSFDDINIEFLPQGYEAQMDIPKSGGISQFSGLQVGPIGTKNETRGLDTYYFPPINVYQNLKNAFSEILPDIARGIIERAKQKKVDIVFLIDSTGSMRDNVQGVKDNINLFLEIIKGKNFDFSLGLVSFSDLPREAKVFDTTKDIKKFRKFLDKIVFMGGGDIPESGYEALISAIEKVDFRNDAQKFFIFISDAPQHDFDYDGQSRYTLDRIIAIMNREGITIDVIGANYLPIRQLAYGTGGTWKHIPNGDPTFDVPILNSPRIRSYMERSLLPEIVEDKLIIEFGDKVPDWVDISYKMLDPKGLKCLGTLTYRKEVTQKTQKTLEFSPKLDLSKFQEDPGIYTLIYRVRDSIGNLEILRRTLELRRINS